MEIDNSANNDDVYFKMYDSISPVVGEDDPDIIIRCVGNEKTEVAIIKGMEFNDLSFAVVAESGTAGTTNPANAVEVKMVTS